MKICPHCGRGIRDHVVKCSHCGESVAGMTLERTPDDQVAANTTPSAGPPTSTAPGDYFPPAPGPSRPAPVLVPGSRIPAQRVSVPKKHHINASLLAGALLLTGGGIESLMAVGQNWARVQVTIADLNGSLAVTRPAADLIFRGTQTPLGRGPSYAAIAMVLIGLVWLRFSLDRGLELPLMVRPLLVVAGAFILGIAVNASQGGGFWNDALVHAAPRAHISEQAMRQILGAHPIVEVSTYLPATRYLGGVGAAFLGAVIASIGRFRQMHR